MNKTRVRELRKDLIEILGMSPTPLQWRRWKKMMRAGAKLSPERSAIIRAQLLEGIKNIKPAAPKILTDAGPWQRPEAHESPSHTHVVSEKIKVPEIRLSWWRRFLIRIAWILGW